MSDGNKKNRRQEGKAHRQAVKQALQPGNTQRFRRIPTWRWGAPKFIKGNLVPLEPFEELEDDTNA